MTRPATCTYATNTWWHNKNALLSLRFLYLISHNILNEVRLAAPKDEIAKFYHQIEKISCHFIRKSNQQNLPKRETSFVWYQNALLLCGLLCLAPWKKCFRSLISSYVKIMLANQQKDCNGRLLKEMY